MKILLTRIFPLLILAVSFSSCKKKCDLPDNAYLGEIESEISIFSSNSLAVDANSPDDYLITSEDEFSGIKMSSDGGVTKTPFNYGSYSILCYPTTTTCNSSFTRNVEIDDINGIIIYTIDITQCETCDEGRTSDNAVVIRAVPDSYQVVFDVNGI